MSRCPGCPLAVFILSHAVWLWGVFPAAAQTGLVVDASSPAVAGSIAVMPFTNVTGQSADDWIGVGIAEVVMADLSQLGRSVMGQGVIADTPNDGAVLASARQVGATWLVSGAFQHLGSDLRVTARVVEVRSGDVVHRAKIDGQLHDLFSVQDRIAEAIVERLAEPVPAGSAVSRRDWQVPPGEGERMEAALGPDTVTGALTLELPEGVEVSSGSSDAGATGAGFMRPPRSAAPGTVAVRTSRPPVLDGRLDDMVWSEATHITDFVQITPLEGAPGTEETEVWIAYDRDNLYFALGHA